MANETTTSTSDDPIFVSWVTDRILAELRPYNVSKPLFRYAGPQTSKRYDFPTQTDPSVASATAIGDGTAASNTALSTGVGSATAAVKGMVATVTDLLQAVMVTDAVDHFAAVLGRSAAERVETDCSANYANFSNVTGTSGSDFTIAQMIAAVGDLESRDVADNLVATFHPIQVLDLRSGSGNTPGGILPGFAASQEGMNFLANPNFNQSIVTDLSTPSGYVGKLLGVDIYETSAVATANTAADRAGAIWARGEALGFYELWDVRVEMHRDAFQPGTQVAATVAFGTCEIDDLRGESIITDA